MAKNGNCTLQFTRAQQLKRNRNDWTIKYVCLCVCVYTYISIHTCVQAFLLLYNSRFSLILAFVLAQAGTLLKCTHIHTLLHSLLGTQITFYTFDACPAWPVLSLDIFENCNMWNYLKLYNEYERAAKDNQSSFTENTPHKDDEKFFTSLQEEICLRTCVYLWLCVGLCVCVYLGWVFAVYWTKSGMCKTSRWKKNVLKNVS